MNHGLYLNHEDLNNYEVFDIETDGLNPTQIWCAVFHNIGTGLTRSYYGSSLRSDIREHIASRPRTYFVAHNGLSFDCPVIDRLAGVSIPFNRSIDTLVLSYLYNPRMPGGHSLEAWGDRFRQPKQEHNDWSKFTPAMLERCESDVALTVRLFRELTKRMASRGFSEKSCELEHQSRKIINEQERNGFYFDRPRAEALSADLRTRAQDLEQRIQQLLPPELVSQATYSFRTTKSNEPHASYRRHLEQYPKLTHNEPEGTYDVWDWKPFNIGSPKQRIEKLLGMGWEPTRFTEKGSPQVDEESLVEFANKSGITEVQNIADWLVITARAGMIDNWLSFCGEDDSRIHGRVFTCGASTRRMTHSSPNTANIASNEAPYGRECRELWTVSDTGRRVLVGHDAKAAQMRLFAHYNGDPGVAKLYIEGDPHQFNGDALGIERRYAKNTYYAFIFGARPKKLGAVGCGRVVGSSSDVKFGKFILKTLFDVTPGLRELIERAEDEYNRNDGFLRTIDGGYVRCPSPHAAINYLIQSAEVIVMKQASVFIDERVKEKGLDCLKVGDIHDEGQDDCAKECAEEVGKIKAQAIADAGEEFNLSVPMAGDYKIGPTWASTH